MKLDTSKLKSKFFWQMVILVVGCFTLLAELVILGVFLVGRFFGGPDNGQDERTDQGASGNHATAFTPVFLKPNEFTQEDFAYDGEYLSCTARPAELGIDVSSHQGEIDWQQVRQAGFTFAIIRVGGRGYGEEGRLFADEYAKANYDGAKRAGLRVGAYFFSQATNTHEAWEEARFALELIKGWELDLPLVYDWELLGDYARTAGMTEVDKLEFTKKFFETVSGAGVLPMAYVAPWASQSYMEFVQDYPVWVVQYSDKMTFPYRFDYWQYSCTGTVPGISVDVDINLYIPPAE